MLLTIGTHSLSEKMALDLESLKTQALHKLEQIKEKTCVGAEYTGWWDWPEQKGFEELTLIREEISKIDVYFDLVLVIGIGGSYAGTKAIAEALRHQYSDRLLSHTPQNLAIVYAGQNLSEQAMIELMELLEEHEPIVNVISKSGSTIEPNIAFRIIEEAMFKRFGKEASKRILVTTQKEKSALFDLSQKRGYKQFTIPKNVGGRYSVFTAVGLLPLTLAAYDTEQLLLGADALFASLRSELHLDHPVLTYAAFRRLAWEESKGLDILAYREPKLAALVEWWKQLFAESEGKESKGLMPLGMMYTTDLHSLGQYLQEGPACMIETFLSVGPSKKLLEKRLRIPADETGASESMQSLFHRYVSDVDDAAWKASQLAHAQRGVPCIELNLAHLDLYHLGYLLAFFQSACAISSLLLEVNPFNQEGVEVYKKELRKILEGSNSAIITG